MDYDIGFSFHQSDFVFAQKLENVLNNADYSVWYDDIDDDEGREEMKKDEASTSAELSNGIDVELSTCGIILILLSEAYSKSSPKQEECNFLTQLNKFVIKVELENFHENYKEKLQSLVLDIEKHFQELHRTAQSIHIQDKRTDPMTHVKTGCDVSNKKLSPLERFREAVRLVMRQKLEAVKEVAMVAIEVACESCPDSFDEECEESCPQRLSDKKSNDKRTDPMTHVKTGCDVSNKKLSPLERFREAVRLVMRQKLETVEEVAMVVIEGVQYEMLESIPDCFDEGCAALELCPQRLSDDITNVRITRLIDEEKLFMRVLDSQFSGKYDQGRKFVEALLPDEENEEFIQIHFENVSKGDHPVLEAACHLYYDIGDEGEEYNMEKLLGVINQALDDADFGGRQITKREIEEKTKDIESKIQSQVEFEVKFKDPATKTKVFDHVARKAPDCARILGHFLLNYEDVLNLGLKLHVSNKELVRNILEKWDEDKDPYERWTYLKQILHILRKLRLIKEIEKM